MVKQLDYKETEHWRSDAFELRCWRRLLRVPWTTRGSNLSILKEISPWIVAKAETPILWPPDAKNWLVWKDPDAGKDWRLEKGTTEDEMVGWHQWLNGRKFGRALVVGDAQGGLVCCRPWDHKSQTWLRDWTELNWCERYYYIFIALAICEYCVL